MLWPQQTVLGPLRNGTLPHFRSRVMSPLLKASSPSIFTISHPTKWPKTHCQATIGRWADQASGASHPLQLYSSATSSMQPSWLFTQQSPSISFFLYSCNTEGILISLQSVSQFSRSVVYDSLQPHELQHSRPPCPSPTPGVHSNSSPSSP